MCSTNQPNTTSLCLPAVYNSGYIRVNCKYFMTVCSTTAAVTAVEPFNALSALRDVVNAHARGDVTMYQLNER